MRTHMVSRVVGVQIDRAEGPIQLEVRRPVLQQVLAAQLLLDADEAQRNVLDLDRIEGLSAGCLGDIAQHLVALVPARAHIRC